MITITTTLTGAQIAGGAVLFAIIYLGLRFLK